MYFIKRTCAYFIDCLICYTLIMLVFQWAILSKFRDNLGITNEWFETSWNMELYVLVTISLPVWLYFIYYDSYKSKGTIGKRILKLSVRNNENQRISLGKSFRRTLLKLAPWEIAHIGIIFPTPIYFENEPGIRILTILGIFLFVAYVASIIIDAAGQSLYDKLLGTKVISKVYIDSHRNPKNTIL
ncbi:MAG: RDD family protein [Bacteroidia bacterium]|nr:RDD family protein [Bacteroidia bacterium]